MNKSIENKIAVILVNYNGYNDTIECIKSILQSTYTNYKIILVDNGSDDAEIIHENQLLNENCSVILCKDNLGFSGGNNIGIRYAEKTFHPDYYFLLNNDTVIDTHTLENMINAYDCVEHCGIMTGRILYYSDPNIIWSAGGKFDFKTGIADQPAMGKHNSREYDGIYTCTFCNGCAMMIPASILKQVGYLEESYFLYAEDTDYCCRVLNAGFKLYYTGNALIYHKVSSSTGKKSDLSQYYNIRNNFYIIKKYCSHPSWGYVKRWYRIIKAIAKRELSINNIIRGYSDFRNGITGKRNL